MKNPYTEKLKDFIQKYGTFNSLLTNFLDSTTPEDAKYFIKLKIDKYTQLQVLEMVWKEGFQAGQKADV